jgi:hypothetical protein
MQETCVMLLQIKTYSDIHTCIRFSLKYLSLDSTPVSSFSRFLSILHTEKRSHFANFSLIVIASLSSHKAMLSRERVAKPLKGNFKITLSYFIARFGVNLFLPAHFLALPFLLLLWPLYILLWINVPLI